MISRTSRSVLLALACAFTAPRCSTFLIYSSSRLMSSIRERRSEEHTSELQSRENLVCRLLLEKKKTYPKDQSQENIPNRLKLIITKNKLIVVIYSLSMIRRIPETRREVNGDCIQSHPQINIAY